ncbi:hypothetical protein LSH36_1001g00016 [Paralvinella palmiformis]|uniref:Inositol polyphosphate-related phosphatase domain-containing protein n=1 Tax=Paralvinella palmiformis TaxID=53620 RepID=A0AAD9IXB9_9ANNE|nr:hypothetical protein LSH36_1001g00016 [Paralvinella palmiformis]
MDLTGIVNCKLLDRDKCISNTFSSPHFTNKLENITYVLKENLNRYECLLATRVLLGNSKQPVVMALIECQGDFGLLLYICKKIPATAPIDLEIDTVIPIDEHFKLSIAAQIPSQPTGALPVQITSALTTISLELPSGHGTTLMLSELKRTRQGWPFSAILQANVGKDCPVVKDTRTMEHVLSPDQASMTDSGSFQGSFHVSDSNDLLRRSYDHSIDQLSVAVNSHTVKNTREDLIKHLIKNREDEYTSIKTYRFQELDLSKNAYIFSESPKEEEWYRRVKEGLHHKAKYKKMKLIRLVGIMLVVFVRTDLVDHMYDVMWDTVGTGILGMMGNKGGVGVRFDFHDTSICFINSHLAAHVEEYDRRNQDFRDISSKMAFSRNKTQPECGIVDHDMVFWLGDLNYRLSDIENDRAKLMIKNRQLTDLMNYDQLCRQIAMKKVFLDYVEGRVNFIPTYKYDPGTDDWDTSEKCRTPAWCDRILWRGHNIRQLKYRSHMECRISDHKPVSAVFEVGIKVINRNEYRQVYEDIMKQLDRMENEYLPQVALSTTEVNFVNVKFVEPQQQIVTVTNTGQLNVIGITRTLPTSRGLVDVMSTSTMTPARKTVWPCYDVITSMGLVQFEFINKPRDTTFCKPWLLVMPSRGIIDVGEKLEIQLEVYVDSTTSGPLNIGDDIIEDILVLHLEGGKDLFITVSGNYIPSSFGCSIETLVNMFNPIRRVPVSELKQLVTRGQLSSDQSLDVPKELYWLIDHLYRYGLQQRGILIYGRIDSIRRPPGGDTSRTVVIRRPAEVGPPYTGVRLRSAISGSGRVSIYQAECRLVVGVSVMAAL